MTKTDCQVLVHPYNRNLQPISSVIDSEIGPEIMVDFLAGDTGPIVTEAGYLGHTVSKIYHVVHDESVELPEQRLVTRCLDQAVVDGKHSIAFPLAIAPASDMWTLAHAYAIAVRQWVNGDANNIVLRRIEFVATKTIDADVLATVFREVLLAVQSEKLNDDDDNLDPGIDLPISGNNAGDNSQGDWHTIERILRHRRRKGGDEFLVKWEETGTTSWVKRRDVTDAALQEYYKNRKQRKRRKSRC